MLRPSITLVLALAALVVVACGHPRSPEARATDFCAAAYAGDTRSAGDAASEVTAAIDARDRKTTAAPVVADWLRSLPCVESVTVSTDIIETDPGTQEIGFVLRARDGDSRRSCNADLRLGEPFTVGVHASSFVSTNPDHRCTPL